MIRGVLNHSAATILVLMYAPKAPKYRDFRKMLEKEDKNIDAVTVAIPDNTHAVAAMMAIEMGKHVYCEKPLTHTIYEARKLTQAAQEAKVATQMGNHGQASESVRLLCEFIWDGVIGPVRKVHVWTDRAGIRRTHGIGRPTGAPPVPSNLDWDLWLGPAPNRPYHPSYLPGMWRAWWDFGTGALGDIGCHRFAPIFRALKLKYPTSVCARSTSHFMAVPGRNRIVNSETYPVGSIVRYQFPARGNMPPVKLIWYDGGLMPERPEELEPGRPMRDNGMLLVGDKGKLLDGRLIPELKMKEYKRPPKTLPRSIGHYEEWIEACKGGQPAGSNFDNAGPLTEVVLLGNLSVRTGKKLNWDGTNMVVTNRSEANEYIHRQYRKGWTLI
jgi:hypothetical protein